MVLADGLKYPVVMKKKLVNCSIYLYDNKFKLHQRTNIMLNLETSPAISGCKFKWIAAHENNFYCRFLEHFLRLQYVFSQKMNIAHCAQSESYMHGVEILQYIHE